MAITASLSRFSWAAQPGAWGPSLCWDMVFIPASSFQLIWTSYRRGYKIVWYPPTSCERHNSHSIQPLDCQGRSWSPDIFDRMHLLFPQVHFFFSQLGRVGGQYVTIWEIGGKWTYRSIFCFQDLFKTTHSTFVLFPLSFFSMFPLRPCSLSIN